MTVNYTSLLGLALPVTGTEAGAWGDVVNNYLTSYLDASVAGTQTITGSQTAVTLAVTNGATLVTVGSGATGSAQFQIITCTGNPASLLTITAPASSRQYIIINSTSTSQSVKIVGAGPTTGVTIVSGEKAHVAWNGSDFVKIATQSGNGSFVDLTVSGNLTLSGGTQNGVLYLNASRVATSGSALTFDGTNLGVNSASPIDGGRFSVAFAGNTQNGIGLKDTADASGASFWAAYNSTGGFIGSLRRSSTDNALAINGNSYLAFQQNSTELMRLTSTGLKASIAGTNADPVFSYTSDTNTGIFFPAADKLGFTAGGGSDQMVLTSTGLGIGTSSPAAYAKLAVTGTAGAQTDANQQVVINAPTTTAGQGAGIRFNVASGAKEAVGVIGVVNEASGNAGAMTFHVYDLGATIPEYMRLDSSGNLGLGVTPSAWSAAFKALQVSPRAAIWGDTSQTILSHNMYTDGTDKYIANGFATLFSQQNGAYKWFTAPSGTANSAVVAASKSYTVVALGTTTLVEWQASFNDASNNPLTVTPTLGQVLTSLSSPVSPIPNGGLVTQNISFTQAMTLDASGNLLVGNTTQYGTANRAAVFSANKFGLSIIDTTAQATGVGGALNLGGNYRTTGDAQAFVRVAAAKENSTDNNYAYAMTFSTTPNGGTFTEAARITSDGNLGVGTISPSNRVQSRRDATTDASNSQFIAENRTGAVGQYTLYGSRLDDGAGAGFTPVAFGAVQTAAAGRKADFVIAVSDTDNIDLSTDIRARIDSSGNLGLGVTPSANWGTVANVNGIYRVMQVGATAAFGGNQSLNRAYMFSNVYWDGSNYKYLTTGPSPATWYEQSDGAHYWFRAASGSGGATISQIQAMTLDASGFLVVGDTTTGISRFTSASTSYPETTEYAGVFKAGTASPLSNRYLFLRQTYTGGAFDSLPLVWEANADVANQKSYGVIQTIADGSIVFSNKAAGAAVAIGTALGVAERARITSTGGFETRPAATGHAVFNEDGVDADFRVEGDTDTHLIFADASADQVGIGTNNTDNFKLAVKNGAGNLARFTNGATQTMDVVLDSSGFTLQNPNNGYIAFKGSSNERARITSGGDFFIGNGETAASPSAGVLSATGGTGTDIAGANLTIRGGASTGSGAGGVIIFSTAAAGASGTTVRSATEAARITSDRNLLVGETSSNSGNNGLKVKGQFALTTAQTFTASGSVNDSAYYIVCYSLSATCTLTLPTPANNTGRLLNIVVQSAQQVVSASSNVTAIADGTVGTAILPATAGKWAQLWCDGAYWNIIATNV